MPKKITAKVSREPIDTERMTECVRAIKEREQAKKFIEKEIADYKSEIQAVMTSHGIEEMQCDVFTVRYRMTRLRSPSCLPLGHSSEKL